MLPGCLLFALASLCGAQPSDDARIRPFTINVPDAVIRDLKARLSNARFREPLQQDGWTYGTDLTYLKALVAYWRDGYDWRAEERKLNRLEQSTTDNLILVTDDPIHHLDPKAIAQLRKPGAPVLVPTASHAKFPDGIAMANGESTSFGSSSCLRVFVSS